MLGTFYRHALGLSFVSCVSQFLASLALLTAERCPLGPRRERRAPCRVRRRPSTVSILKRSHWVSHILTSHHRSHPLSAAAYPSTHALAPPRTAHRHLRASTTPYAD